jgi:N-acetylglutamate synthase-like GNAT family acetyltransferase
MTRHNYPFKVVIPSTDEDWSEYYNLRWQLLRAPLGQEKGSEKDEFEASAYHVLVKNENNSVIGVGRIHIVDDGMAQVRFIAVVEQWRGRKVGSIILSTLEKYAWKAGVSLIRLNAREDTLRFYQFHGYNIASEGHTLFGQIKHLVMHKQLTATTLYNEMK